uniref:Baculoviral IAP repeat-containing protein n=1 Tax=Metapenaeus joyneri majanivirus TaxID=2984280 RepID=A0A9C7BIE5_9VIRU|nr:MAG: baculoviral IAP repeat-containing protein [Metapenaeus joyneri majanivirus]
MMSPCPCRPGIPILYSDLDLRFEKNRLETFQNNLWPHEWLNPQELAADGFSYLGTKDHCICFFCKGIIGAWERGDTPRGEHCLHFPSCEFIRGLRPDNVPINDTINSYFNKIKLPQHLKALHMNYLDINKRRESFKRWPTQTPNDLADAGFFATGDHDCVECFVCGIRLQNWKMSTIPWIEHAKNNPNCNFVLLNKGQEFVNKIIQEVKIKEETERRDMERLNNSNVNGNDIMEETASTAINNLQQETNSSSLSITSINFELDVYGHNQNANIGADDDRLLQRSSTDNTAIIMTFITNLQRRPDEEQPETQHEMEVETEQRDREETEQNNNVPREEETEQNNNNNVPREEETEQNNNNNVPREEETEQNNKETEQNNNNNVPREEETEQNNNNNVPREEETEQNNSNNVPREEETEQNNNVPREEETEQNNNNNVPREEETEQNNSNNVPREEETEQNNSNNVPREEETDDVMVFELNDEIITNNENNNNSVNMSEQEENNGDLNNGDLIIIDYLLNINTEQQQKKTTELVLNENDREKLKNIHQKQNDKAEMENIHMTPHARETWTNLKKWITDMKERENCKVCMTEKSNIITFPCGHIGVCSNCIVGLIDCPFCRAKINFSYRAIKC